MHIGRDLTKLNYRGGTGYILSYFHLHFLEQDLMKRGSKYTMDLITLWNIYISLDIHRYVSHSKIKTWLLHVYVPSNMTLWLCVYKSLGSAYSN